MKRQFFSGNTLEQAVLAAARHFEIDPERVAYSQREKKHGFLKVRRRFVIEVDPSTPELPPEEARPLSMEVKPAPELGLPLERDRPAKKDRVDITGEEEEGFEEEGFGQDESHESEEADAEEAPRFEQVPMSESASVERAVREVLRFLDLRAEVEVHRQPDGFEVEISDTDKDVLLDREGKVLQAIEYLVPRIVRGWMGQGVPVKIDCEGFRESREQELQELAERVADEVRSEGESKTLDPMGPADRRLIHLCLVDDPEVETESEGDGYYKRVRISPVDPDLLDESLA